MKQPEFSKRLVLDIRVLLWIVTLGGLILAGWCIWKGFTASLPWLSAMVGLPWSAHGVVCSFYLNMAKSDHSEAALHLKRRRPPDFNSRTTGKALKSERRWKRFEPDDHIQADRRL